ncbi:MAG: two-component system, NtrC family, response regulator HydG [Candidatus Sumerlaeota bacterium]|nr:two-component system, NtrC family, response regulator HydG [Candidatus Sumerlaeota bacterium]
MPRYRLLIVDDEARICQLLSLLASRWGYDVRTANNGQQALQTLEEFPAEVVLTDLKMPGMDGDELLREIKSRNADAIVIMMTAHATVKSAVESMKAGAYDYIMKPFDNDELRLIIKRALDHRDLLTENRALRAELGVRFQPGNIIGESPAMEQVLELIDRVAPTRATVLITGESGVGKELVARAIHQRSTRAGKPFVALNCAALTETLLESELFGHEKGSFTGATRTHHGKFEDADNGTIFLDEIGETDNNFQTKLLRVLQEGIIVRVGGNDPIKVDVRVLAATNKDLKILVAEGRFREDLFYRLQVVPMHIPPLRERREDIEALARHFVSKACQENGLGRRELSPEALEALRQAEWRGNVRELENTIERAVILTRGEVIEVDDLWLPPSDGDTRRASSGALMPDSMANLPLNEFIDAMTQQHVLRALERTAWKKQEASDLLGIDRATLYRMIKRFGLDKAQP